MHNTAAARATIPMIFLFYFFYDLAYTPLLVAYTLEILPFRIRAKGFAVMVRINAVIILSQLIHEIVELDGHGHPSVQRVRQSMGTRCHFVVVLCCVLWLAHPRALFRRLFHCGNQRYDLSLSFTRRLLLTHAILGRTLEETAALFDGDDQQQDIAAMGGQAADVSSRLSRGVVLPELEPETRQISESAEKVNEYYEMKKRYRDSSNTGSSSHTHRRAI